VKGFLSFIKIRLVKNTCLGFRPYIAIALGKYKFQIFNNELLIKVMSNDHGVSLISCCRLVNDLYDHPLNPNLTSIFKWLVKNCVCVQTIIIVSA
jgi:hypothetical protein